MNSVENYIGSVTVTVTLFVTVPCLLLFLFLFRRRGTKANIPPGPPRWPVVGNIVALIRAGKQPDVLFKQWADRYGKILSVSNGERMIVALSDFDLIMEVMHHPSAQGRAKSAVSTKSYGEGQGIATGGGDIWKQQRKFALDLFRKFGVGKSTFENIVTKEAQTLLDEFRKTKGRPMEVSFIFSMAGCNIISGVVFGQQLSYDDPKLLQTLKTVLEFFQQGGPGGAYYSSKILASLPFGPGKKILNILKILGADWSKQIDLHEEKVLDMTSGEAENFTEAWLLKMKENGDSPSFNRVNLLWNLKELYLGGTETISSTMQWAFLLLMTHQDVQRRCQAEMDKVIGRERDPCLADRCKLPFLNATMEEISRIGSVVPLGGPHLAEADIELGDYHIPKGSLIVANLHLLHHDPELWDDPYVFNPERFLDEDGNFSKNQANIVFGVGKRSCIGQELARMEYYLWLSHILHRLNLCVPEGTIPPSIHKAQTGFNRIPEDFEVCVVERDD